MCDLLKLWLLKMYAKEKFLNFFNQAIPEKMSFEELLLQAAVAEEFILYRKNAYLYYFEAAMFSDFRQYPEIIETAIRFQNTDNDTQLKLIAKHILGLGLDIQVLSNYKNDDDIKNICTKCFIKKTGLKIHDAIFNIFQWAYTELEQESESVIARQNTTKKINKLNTEPASYAQVNYKTEKMFINCDECKKYEKCNRIEYKNCYFIRSAEAIVSEETNQKNLTNHRHDTNDKKLMEIIIEPEIFKKYKKQFVDLKCYYQKTK